MSVRFATPASNAHRHQLLIRHILEGSIAAAAEQEIVYRGEHRQSYADLLERVNRLAGMLKTLGVRPGETVAVMDWDSHRYLEAYFAVPMMGAVLQTVNVRLSTEQLVYCLRSSTASVLLFHRDFAPLLDAVLPHLPGIRCRVLIADGEDFCKEGTEGEYEELLSASHARFDFPEFDENALATTFHTTGTTGNPKAVSFSHRQLVLHALSLTATLASQPDGQGFRRGDVYMPLTPMFHVHAWGMPYVATMAGAKQVYPGRYEPELLLKLKRDERVNFSHCVPTVLQMLLGAATAAGHKSIGPWTLLIGGSALSSSLQETAATFGINALAGYGMSETAPTICVARHDRNAANDRGAALRRAGMPIPLVQTMIVDPDMNPLPADGRSEGELVLRAPWLTQSYEGDVAASEGLWRGGWLHTQDLAVIDQNGAVAIRDRLKDVIKTGGEWVSSTQVEDLIMLHPDVAEAAVIAIPDMKWGERPFAFVVPIASAAASLTADLLRNHLVAFVDKGLLNRIAIPENIAIVESLPRTSVGKIDKKNLRTHFEGRSAAKA
ncbi:long-chain-fatty-acid--CoA ligase [Paraburkholderia sp. GAS348]|jgi:fatty-acyl-CoA synthase|uniref:long-chain-fatty-acid--CoA ligase n=1 Tax=Paraburkholderia sp. GAS348 TaxID=3035132 RepID=UPI003D2316AB